MYVRAYNDYLVANGVGGVAPTWQLLRTASDWQKCGYQPFEVPPTTAWPNIVAALRFIGAFIEPVIGQVEPVSVYRNPALNDCAGGARTSTHLTAGAVDMVPLRPISREALMETLCRIQLDKGSWNAIGLGFYKGLRFHIDSQEIPRMGHRRGAWRLWLPGGAGRGRDALRRAARRAGGRACRPAWLRRVKLGSASIRGLCCPPNTPHRRQIEG